MNAIERRLRRFYVDAESKPPEIRAVLPGDEDYDYAHATLTAAKEAILGILNGRMDELKETVRNVRALRLNDFNKP
ncbi:hypothetical protein [Streptomyces sp. NPDC006879]|uniref:hypothetical protein n=1 Tax=Streptomyces sp. NPDC006879 TaxID=3364767 RepID=UPI0036BA668C